MIRCTFIRESKRYLLLHTIRELHSIGTRLSCDVYGRPAPRDRSARRRGRHRCDGAPDIIDLALLLVAGGVSGHRGRLLDEGEEEMAAQVLWHVHVKIRLHEQLEPFIVDRLCREKQFCSVINDGPS